MTTLVVGGDIYPAGNIEQAFIAGSAGAIFHDLLDVISRADLSIVNLESPLISRETPIEKPGGVLGANRRSISGLVAAGWDVLNLANNHSFDHGTEGLIETIHTIEGAGLARVGAGANIEDAQKPFIAQFNGERIVVYSMAEREFSVADKITAGSNPLDLIGFVHAVQRYKEHGTFVVLLHGGKEFYPYPSPEMVRKCRFMIDMGADAVICCHAHCPLPWEIYADRPIVYGLGNLIFEPVQEQLDSWHEGYLARLTIEEGHVYFEPIPYYQSRGVSGAQIMEGIEAKRFLTKMEEKGAQVKDAAFLEDKWMEFCRQQKAAYLTWLFGYKKPMRRLRRMLLPLLHSKKELHRALLLVQCETHQEVLSTIFRDERHQEE